MIPALLVFSIGAICTYTKSIRESWVFLPIFVGLSLLSGWLWVTASRRFDSTANIMLFSLVWDILMVLAYYAGPIILKGDRFGWQAYAAAMMTVAGIFWFKIATSSD
jgi:hypothetical protein